MVGGFNGFDGREFDWPWVGMGLMDFALQVHGGGDGFVFSSASDLFGIWIEVWWVGLTDLHQD